MFLSIELPKTETLYQEHLRKHCADHGEMLEKSCFISVDSTIFVYEIKNVGSSNRRCIIL